LEARCGAQRLAWGARLGGSGPLSALRGERVGRVARRSRVAVHGEAVHGERVGEQVQLLTFVSHRVGSAEEEGVIEGAVDALGVVASSVEPDEVGVYGGCSDPSF